MFILSYCLATRRTDMTLFLHPLLQFLLLELQSLLSLLFLLAERLSILRKVLNGLRLASWLWLLSFPSGSVRDFPSFQRFSHSSTSFSLYNVGPIPPVYCICPSVIIHDRIGHAAYEMLHSFSIESTMIWPWNSTGSTKRFAAAHLSSMFLCWLTS